MLKNPRSICSPEKQEPLQCWVSWALGGAPSLVVHWSVSPQEDVPNTQCGYDVRLKLVRGPGTEMGAAGAPGIGRGTPHKLLRKASGILWGGGAMEP